MAEPQEGELSTWHPLVRIDDEPINPLGATIAGHRALR